MLPLPDTSLTRAVLAAAYEVANTLGPGFLEKVYHQALLDELARRNIPAESTPPIPVRYKDHDLAEYRPDILVARSLVLELKCVESLHPAHIAQCVNYLKATGLRLCLLLNFQYRKLQIKRIIY